MNKMNNRRQDVIRKKLLAFCFAIMMSFTGFVHEAEASLTRPIVYLSGLEKTELSGFDDTVYYPDIEKLYVSRNPNTIVYTRNYFRSLSDLETMLGLGNYVWVSSHGSKGKVATFDEAGNVNGSISVNDFLL